MDIVLVAAVAENGVIGRDGGLPWRLKSDLQYFRALTIGQAGGDGPQDLCVDRQAAARPHQHRGDAAIRLSRRPACVVAREPCGALEAARGDALRRGADDDHGDRRRRHLSRRRCRSPTGSRSRGCMRARTATPVFPPIDRRGMARDRATARMPAGPGDEASFTDSDLSSRDSDDRWNAMRAATGARCNAAGGSPITRCRIITSAGLPDGRRPRRTCHALEQSGRWRPWGSGAQGTLGLRAAVVRARPARPRGAAAPQPGQAADACCRAAVSAARGACADRCSPRSLLWGVSGFFRVQPDELGVVLRFGKYVRDAKPGLNYHLPYPIETRAHAQGHARQPHRHRHAHGRGSAPRHHHARRAGGEPDADRRREHRRRRLLGVLADQADNGASKYLFNIQNPEGTVKAVAESAMREVVGRSNIQPILTGARQNIETGGAGADAEDARRLSAPASRSRRCSCRRSIRRRR